MQQFQYLRVLPGVFAFSPLCLLGLRFEFLACLPFDFSGPGFFHSADWKSFLGEFSLVASMLCCRRFILIACFCLQVRSITACKAAFASSYSLVESNVVRNFSSALAISAFWVALRRSASEINRERRFRTMDLTSCSPVKHSVPDISLGMREQITNACTLVSCCVAWRTHYVRVCTGLGALFCWCKAVCQVVSHHKGRWWRLCLRLIVTGISSAWRRESWCWLTCWWTVLVLGWRGPKLRSGCLARP